MSSRNSVKLYIPESYYHIYNRGVEKRIIFTDEQDYGVFLSYLRAYLLPKDINALQEKLANNDIPYSEKQKILKLLRLNNFSKEVKLLAFCLMPNHFHLLIKQTLPSSIDQFMNSLSTRYVMFFNKKYKRIGPLYQDVYKAVSVKTDEQLLHLSAYIHRNPFPEDIELKGVPFKFAIAQPSSLPEYLGLRTSAWIETKTILSFFSFKNRGFSYEKFVLSTTQPHSKIARLIIE